MKIQTPLRAYNAACEEYKKTPNSNGSDVPSISPREKIQDNLKDLIRKKELTEHEALSQLFISLTGLFSGLTNYAVQILGLKGGSTQIDKRLGMLFKSYQAAFDALLMYPCLSDPIDVFSLPDSPLTRSQMLIWISTLSIPSSPSIKSPERQMGNGTRKDVGRVLKGQPPISQANTLQASPQPFQNKSQNPLSFPAVTSKESPNGRNGQMVVPAKNDRREDLPDKSGEGFDSSGDSSRIDDREEWRDDPFIVQLENDGKYKVLGKIGEGGMGKVLRAKHLIFGSEVAIKIISQNASNITSIKRFIREAKTLRKLNDNHPHLQGKIPSASDCFPVRIDGQGEKWFIVQQYHKPPEGGRIEPNTVSKILGKNIDHSSLSNAYENYLIFLDSLEGSDPNDKLSTDDIRLLIDFIKERSPSDASPRNGSGKSNKKNSGPSSHDQLSGFITALKSQEMTLIDYNSYNRNKKIYDQIFSIIDEELSQNLVKRPKGVGENKILSDIGFHPSLFRILELETMHLNSFDGDSMMMVMSVLREVCGDLFPEKEMLNLLNYFISSFSKAMAEIKKAGIIHRDIKPGNILIPSEASGRFLHMANNMIKFTYQWSRDKDSRAGNSKRNLLIKEVKEALQFFQKHVPFPVIIIDFGLARAIDSPDEDVDVRQSSASFVNQKNTGSRNKNFAGNQSRLTLEGQGLGTALYMNAESALGNTVNENNDPYAGLAMWISIFSGSDSWLSDGARQDFDPHKHLFMLIKSGEIANQLRAEKPPKDFLYSLKDDDHPLSVIDRIPVLVELLRSIDPKLLIFARKALFLRTPPDPNRNGGTIKSGVAGNKVNSYPEFSWEELATSREAFLNSKKEISKKLLIIGCLVSALVVILFFSAYNSHRESLRHEKQKALQAKKLDEEKALKAQKLKEEIESLTGKINEGAKKFDLTDPKYNADYFEALKAAVKRLRELLGAGITDEKKEDLKQKEILFTFLRMGAEYKDISDKFFLAERRSESLESETHLKECESAAQKIVSFMEKYHLTYSMDLDELTSDVSNEYIRENFTDLDKVVKYKNFKFPDTPDVFRNLSKFFMKVVEKYPWTPNEPDHFNNAKTLSSTWLISHSASNSVKFFSDFPDKDKKILLVAIINIVLYWNKRYKFFRNKRNESGQTGVAYRIFYKRYYFGSIMNMYKFMGIIPDPSSLKFTPNT